MTRARNLANLANVDTFTVDSSDRVGLGTTNPGATLQITADTPGILFEDQNSGYTESKIEGSSGHLFFTTANTNRDHIFNATGGSESVRITGDGLVGIGTDSPSSLLHLSSATGTASITPTELRIATTSNASDWSTADPWGKVNFYSSDGSGAGPKSHASLNVIANIANGGTSDLTFDVNNVERLRINSSGNMGLGTNSPLSKFHVLYTNNTSSDIRLTTFNDTQKDVLLRNNNSQFEIHTGTGGAPTAKVVVSNNGNIGVGMNGPTRNLVVNDSSGNAFISVRGSDTGIAGILFGDQTADTPGQISYSNNADSMQFLTDGSEKARILSTGGLTFNGDTATANALDDYEEGIHVPTITLGSGSILTNYNDTLSYVKVGRLVHVQGRIHLSLSTSDVTSFSFTLPFTNCTSLAEQSEDTSGVNHVIRSTGAGGNVAGIRHFRFTANSATVDMQDTNGANTGNFGVTNPHISVNLQYRST